MSASGLSVKAAEQSVVRAAERFEADWKRTLEESYDAATGVVNAVRRLRSARKRAARAEGK